MKVDVTREAGRNAQRGVESVVVYGVPWLHVKVVETPTAKAWALSSMFLRFEISLWFQALK